MEHFRNPFDVGDLASAKSSGIATSRGSAEGLRTRIVIMDNIYEEMRCGELAATHPALYLRMLIRDEGHAGDSLLLFAVSGDDAHFAAAMRDVTLDLDNRCELNDAWLATIRSRTSTAS